MDFVIDQIVAAPPETVFDVLTDHRAYPNFTPMRGAKLDPEGSPDPNGVGAVRVLTVVGPPLRERVTEFERPRRFVYELVSGAPMKNHRGVVELSEATGGTRMVYSVHTEPKYPVIGHIGTLVAKQAVGQLYSGIKKESEQRAKSA